MLRVREIETRAMSREGQASAPGLTRFGPSRASRLAALAALGVALGSGGVIFTASLVQAENDSGIREFHLQETANRRSQSAPTYARPSAYAPSRGGLAPFLQMQPNGRLAHPPVELNPFRSRDQGQAQRKSRKEGVASASQAAANSARTICVRLCDGFHAPLGHLRANADLKAHDALCQAMNPGIPVKVFRVAAGAATIDDARSADGKRYGALPMAFSHETSSDAACRPSVVQSGERRVSLLRDFTLRPGDSVVLDGKVRTFAGSSNWPYSLRDFRDFRSAAELDKSQRRAIDSLVGVSRMEAEARGVRRQLRLREASLRDDSVASDAITLRGPLGAASERGPVRVISIVER